MSGCTKGIGLLTKTSVVTSAIAILALRVVEMAIRSRAATSKPASPLSPALATATISSKPCCRLAEATIVAPLVCSLAKTITIAILALRVVEMAIRSRAATSKSTSPLSSALAVILILTATIVGIIRLERVVPTLYPPLATLALAFAPSFAFAFAFVPASFVPIVPTVHDPIVFFARRIATLEFEAKNILEQSHSGKAGRTHTHTATSTRVSPKAQRGPRGQCPNGTHRCDSGGGLESTGGGLAQEGTEAVD
jgi:hypothetical protein